jgi:4-carboxymuconolactone decarboxylase
MFPGYVSKFLETAPEFIERFDNFAFDEFRLRSIFSVKE